MGRNRPAEAVERVLRVGGCPPLGFGFLASLGLRMALARSALPRGRLCTSDALRARLWRRNLQGSVKVRLDLCPNRGEVAPAQRTLCAIFPRLRPAARRPALRTGPECCVTQHPGFLRWHPEHLPRMPRMVLPVPRYGVTGRGAGLIGAAGWQGERKENTGSAAEFP